MTDPLIETMTRAAFAAAHVIEEIYERPFVAMAKADGSPVTEADQRAEALILEHLAATGIPVLAEESVAAGDIPALGDRFFAVDPLDGTKEFIKRNGEFTVNIALIENGRPVRGVVLAPATGAGYSGGPEGAHAFSFAGGVQRDMRRIVVGDDPHPRMAASRSHGQPALEALSRHLDIGEIMIVGSSLKFCLIAEGLVHLYPRLTPTSEWDTAAGQAVLEAAGGVVLTLDGSPLAYGKAGTGYINPYFAAASSRELGLRAVEEISRLPRQSHAGGASLG